jgi:hypothetical protein
LEVGHRMVSTVKPIFEDSPTFTIQRKPRATYKYIIESYV